MITILTATTAFVVIAVWAIMDFLKQTKNDNNKR